MDIKIEENYLAKAMELHKNTPVVDAHLDLAGEILLRNQGGEKEVIKNHYLDSFQKAGIRLVVSSVFVETGNLDKSWQNALDQITALKEDIKGLAKVVQVESSGDIDRALEEGKIGILLYMEGLDCIGEDIDKLDTLYSLGVRGASLTWSRPNALACGCCSAVEHKQVPGGLSEAGKRAVKRMEELSMFLDVSHLNDDGFDDVCGVAEKSFIATHSCSRRVFDSFRNLTDGQMRRLAAQGGIMGVNGCQCIAGSLRGNHLEMLCRHLEYEAEAIGAEHAGYGFDLCDSYGEARALLRGEKCEERGDCLLNHGQTPLVTAALLQRGMSEENVKKIIGENFLEYFKGML
ncbi:MAG: dipeptidase [Clostridium sp.]|nr:dipeptidase [Clostridium sp.]